MDLKFITIEDGRQCIILDEFLFEEKKYVVLVNAMNDKDFIIRELINDQLVGLEDETQLQNILLYYCQNINKEKLNG